MYHFNRKHKGVESFIYVLVLGLGIFIVIALTTTTATITNPFSLFSSSSNPEYEDTLLNQYSIYDALSNNQPYFFRKIMYLSFGSLKESQSKIEIGNEQIGSYLAYRQIKQIPYLVVKNGLFEHKPYIISFTTTDAQSIKISFYVNQTNRYGKLIIKLNGEEIFANYTYPNQKISIEINKQLTGNNILEIDAENSLPRLWAPTAYELEDLSLEVLDYDVNDLEIKYVLEPDQYEGLKYVELKFNVLDSNEYDYLEIYSNNKKVYEDVFTPSAKPYSIWLYKEDNLKVGTNVIRLVAKNNAYYDLQNIEITIHYYNNAKTYTYLKTFYIDDDEWRIIERNKDLLEGIIVIKPNSVSLDKGITFYINGVKTHINNLEPYRENYAIFDINALKPGENELKIESKSKYDIEYIKIGIRNKQ